MRSRSRSASRIGALGQPCLPPRSSAPSNLRSAYESCATELKLLHTQFPTFSAPRTTEHKMADVAIPSAAPGTSSDIGKKMAPAPAGATEHGPHMKQCVEECRNCEQACLETVPHCLSKGGHHARPDHIMLLMNCASMCATSARFLMSGSHLHTHTCAACKQVCEACADDCQGIMAADAGGGGGDTCMQRCVEACRSCARACGEMLAAARCT